MISRKVLQLKNPYRGTEKPTSFCFFRWMGRLGDRRWSPTSQCGGQRAVGARIGWPGQAVIAGMLVALFVGCIGEGSSGDSQQPGIIVGHSMVPHFYGKHHQASCEFCQFTFKFARESSPEGDSDRDPQPLVCPNCGNRQSKKIGCVRVDADGVWIDDQTTIRRWDVVAFKNPIDSQVHVKRVVGLPGEIISFDRGNIVRQSQGDDTWRLVQKNLAQQRATRILLHDSQFQSTDPRWQTLSPKQLKQINSPARFSVDEFNWNQFQYRRCYWNRNPRLWAPGIEDNYGFNQEISRELNSMTEIAVECNLDQQGRAMVFLIQTPARQHWVRFVHQGDDVLVDCFESDKRGTQWNALAGDRTMRLRSAVCRCQVSNIDDRLIISVNDHLLFQDDYSKTDHGDKRRTATGLATQRNDRVQIFVGISPANGLPRIRIWRDIYYHSRIGGELVQTRQRQQSAQGQSGYFVVGDNLPVSKDSRSSINPYIPKSQIMGSVTARSLNQ